MFNFDLHNDDHVWCLGARGEQEVGCLEREGWRGRDEVGEDHHCAEMRGWEEEGEGDEDQEVGDTACG